MTQKTEEFSSTAEEAYNYAWTEDIRSYTVNAVASCPLFAQNAKTLIQYTFNSLKHVIRFQRDSVHTEPSSGSMF